MSAILSLLSGVSARAWGYLILLAALSTGGLYLHHRWYSAGVDSQAPVVAKLQAQIMALQASGQACSAALKQASDAADQAKADSDAKIKRAAELIQQLGQDAVQAHNALADAQKKLKIAAQTPSCATVASMKLCEAMRGY